MARNLTKTQNEAVLLLRARLDPKHPMFAGSDEVVAALHGEARCYFDTYVLPLLDYLSSGKESYYGEAEQIRRDFASRSAAAQARHRAVNSGAL